MQFKYINVKLVNVGDRDRCSLSDVLDLMLIEKDEKIPKGIKTH